MSDKERWSRPDHSVGGGERSGGADGEDGEETTDPKEKKGKKMSLFRLRKGKKKLPHEKRKQTGVNVNPGCWGTIGGGGWRCSCFNQPLTADTSGESPTSDPNSSEFAFDMLRALIEKNDFYSKECNPHLDANGFK